MMALTNIEKLEYYKKRKAINILIKNQAREKGSILYGGKALNLQLNPILRRPSDDFDIYSKTPRKSADKIERRLDKRIGTDMFFVKPAIHPGTWKVMNRTTGREVVDYSKLPNGVETKKIDGIQVASLAFIKKERRRILRDPQSKFRHKKDRDAIQRINLQQGLKKKRKIRRRPATIFSRVGMLR